MAINMNSIPTEKPAMSTIIPKGCYIAKIVKADMKQGRDETKPPYFSAECDITDPASNASLWVWFIFRANIYCETFVAYHFCEVFQLKFSFNIEVERVDESAELISTKWSF